jgi:phosphoglycolate phosphatase
VPAIFFDLDGTLCDSLPGVAETMRAVVSADAPQITMEQVRSVIGPPVAVMLRKLLPHLDDAAVAALEAEFRRLYDSENWRKFRFFNGVEKTIQALHQQGCQLFVFTNKPAGAARRMIDSAGLGLYFEAVVSKDSRTPVYVSKAEMLQDLLMRYKVDLTDAIVVGDGQEDMEAARSSNLPFVFARYGYGAASAAGGAFHAIDQFQDIIEICNRGL